MRDWLKSQGATVSLPGEARAADDCVLLVRGFRESFEAGSENHALCLAVLLANYLMQHGQKITVKGRW